MLIKQETNYLNYLKYAGLAIVFLLIFLFKTYFINLTLNLRQKFFPDPEITELNVTERTELQTLRVENGLLREEISKMQTEFGVDNIDNQKSFLYLLLGPSNLYGDFYTSFPKNKTPYIGMKVFAYGNILVGEVEEVLKSSLRVSRMGQAKSFIGSSASGDESIEFRSLGLGLYAGTVAGGSKINLGDEIVLRGFPKGIIGTVVEVDKGDNSISTVFVRTPYNLSSKEIYYVLQ